MLARYANLGIFSGMNYYPCISDIAHGKASGAITARVDTNKVSKGKWYISVNSITVTKAQPTLDCSTKLTCSLVSGNNTVRYLAGERSNNISDYLEPLEVFNLHKEDWHASPPEDVVVRLNYDRLFEINSASNILKFYLTPLDPAKRSAETDTYDKGLGDAEVYIHYSLYQRK